MSIRRILGAATAVGLSAFVATGCGNSIPEGAICAVDGEPISQAKFDTLIDQAKRNYKNQGQKFPKKDSTEYEQLRNQAVAYLIEQELYRQRANELGVEVTKKEVDERLDQLKKSFFEEDEKKYEAELEKQGLTEDEVRDNIKQQILTQELFEKVTDDVKVSDKKAREYYEENEDQYKTPASREVAHILVKDKSKAQEIYQQVKGGDKETFTKLAKKHSTDPSSAQSGGTLQANKGQLVPEFEKVAFDLEVGEVSEPVKTSFGWHIITARSKVEPEKKQAFDEVEEQIKQTLEQEQRSKRMQDWKEDLLADAEEKVNCRAGYVWTQTVTQTTDTTGGEGEPSVETVEDEAPTTTEDEAAGDASDEDASATKTTGDEDRSEGDAAPREG